MTIKIWQIKTVIKKVSRVVPQTGQFITMYPETTLWELTQKPSVGIVKSASGFSEPYIGASGQYF